MSPPPRLAHVLWAAGELPVLPQFPGEAYPLVSWTRSVGTLRLGRPRCQRSRGLSLISLRTGHLGCFLLLRRPRRPFRRLTFPLPPRIPGTSRRPGTGPGRRPPATTASTLRRDPGTNCRAETIISPRKIMTDQIEISKITKGENRNKRKIKNQYIPITVILVIVALKIKKNMTSTSLNTEQNFPTRANIEKKKLLQEEKEQRGEVLRTAQFGKMQRKWKQPPNEAAGKHRKWQKWQKWHGGRKTPEAGEDGAQSAPPNGPLPGSSPEEPHEVQAEVYQKDVDPLGMLADSETESDKEEKPENVVIPKEVTSALGLLMTNYGNMSGSESEPEETPIKTEAESPTENQVILSDVPQNQSQDIKKQERNSPVAKTKSLRKNWMRKNCRYRRNLYRKKPISEPQKRRPHLLEMLLAQDIRHERNVILQCVRYIIQNDFFGLNSKTEPLGKTENGQVSEVSES
ncbi:FMR1-interacting protein NUFIP1 isoform X2 [Notamacropus eugenii]|uniref:FMR1-interacting protein NUFIP1 isoform X2 n=1 Tax=Notamacropus eugenii TaxID=9315 RepID=UPI003B6751C2